jgi:hypothetical protein
MFTSPSDPAAAPSERRPHELERSVTIKTDAAPRILTSLRRPRSCVVHARVFARRTSLGF